MSDIEKLEGVFASSFLTNNATVSTVGPVTVSIVEAAGRYEWKMWDADDSGIQSSKSSFSSLADAKYAMRDAVQDMINRKRASQQS